MRDYVFYAAKSVQVARCLPGLIPPWAPAVSWLADVASRDPAVRGEYKLQLGCLFLCEGERQSEQSCDVLTISQFQYL